MHPALHRVFSLFILCGMIFTVPKVSAAKPIQDGNVAVFQSLESIKQMGGGVTSVVPDGGLAYIGQGNRLVVLDVSSPNYPAQVGQSAPLDSDVTDVVIVDQTAYVATGYGPTYVMDLSDNAQPVVVQALGEAHAGRLFQFDHYLLAGLQYGSANVILDISNPSAPVKAAEYPDLGAVDMVMAGAQAYFLLPTGVKTVDFTTPAFPKATGFYEKNWTPIRLAQQGSLIAVVGNPGLFLIDFSQPASPKLLNDGGNSEDNQYYPPLALAMTSSTLYIATYQGIQLYNISQPQSPKLLKTISLGRYFGYDFNRFVLSGKQAYLAIGKSGLVILDLSNPLSPYEVGNFYQAGITSFASQANFLYAVVGNYSLSVIDVSRPQNPVWRGNLATNGYINAVAVSGSKAYLADNSWYVNFRVVDISNPDQPAQLSAVRLGQNIYPQDIQVKGHYAYLALGEAGLGVVDVSNPAEPVMGTIVAIPGRVDKISVTDSYLFLSGYGVNDLSLVSLADPAVPVLVGNYAGAYPPYTVASSGKYAYVGDGAGLSVLDTSTPAHPVQVSRLDGVGNFSSLVVDQSVIYAGNMGNLFIVDVAAPANPQLLWQVGVSGDRLQELNGALFALGYTGKLTLLKPFASTRAELSSGMSGALISPDGQVSYSFPEGSYDWSVDMVHRQVENEYHPLPPGKAAIGQNFTLEAITGWSNQAVQPKKPYTIQVKYTPSQIGEVVEDTLELYSWDGRGWVKEPTSSLDKNTHTISATPSLTGHWAVFGVRKAPPHAVYLPVMVNRSGGADLWINGLELTQEIQRTDNSVPLVASRSTYLRVHVQSNGTKPVSGVYLRITGTRDGAPLPGSPLTLGPWAIFTAPDRRLLGQTYNLKLPDEWTVGNLELHVSLDPDQTIAEPRKDNNDTSINVSFRLRPSLKIVLVPFQYTHSPSGVTYPAVTADTISHYILEKFPLSTIDPSLHAPVSFAGDLTQPGGWTAFLNKLTDLKSSEGGAYQTLYYGIAPDTDLPYVYGGMGWYWTRASVGVNGAVIVHEAGHNFGLPHAPCGVQDADPKYPYPGGLIGQWGLDVYNLTVYDPATTYDLMSYCGSEIFSDYNYEKLFNAEGNSLQSEPILVDQALLVRGEFNADGGFTLKPVYTIEDTLVEQPERADVNVELLDANGQVVAVEPVTVLETDEGQTTYRAINTLVPLPEQPVSALRLIKEGVVLAEQTLSVSASTVSQTAAIEEMPGETRLIWEDGTTPVLVRMSQDGGSTWQTLGIDLIGGTFNLQGIDLSGRKSEFEMIPADAIRGSAVRVQYSPIQ